MPKNIIRKSISDAQLRSELIKLFEGGNTSNTNIYEHLRTKYKLMKQRFVKMYHSSLNEWQGLKEKATADQVQVNTYNALKSGLKSKLDKQLHLQNEINGIQSDLDKGIMPDYIVVGGKLQIVNKVMDAETKAYLRKTMKDIYAELNKMEGDYAPQKIAETTVNGKDVKRRIGYGKRED